MQIKTPIHWSIGINGIEVTATPVGVPRFTHFRYPRWNRGRSSLRIWNLDPNVNTTKTVDPADAQTFELLVGDECREIPRARIRPGYYRPTHLYVTSAGSAFLIEHRITGWLAKPVHLCEMLGDPHLDEKVRDLAKEWESKIWIRWSGLGPGVWPEADTGTLERITHELSAIDAP